MATLEDLKNRLGKNHPMLEDITENVVRTNQMVRYAVNNYSDVYIMSRKEKREFRKQYRDLRHYNVDAYQKEEQSNLKVLNDE